MIRSRLSLVALLLASIALTACSNPTAPQAKPAKVSAGWVQGSSI
jgi:hypothetical protein